MKGAGGVKGGYPGGPMKGGPPEATVCMKKTQCIGTNCPTFVNVSN